MRRRRKAGRPFEVTVHLLHADFAFEGRVFVRGKLSGAGLANDREGALRGAIAAHRLRIAHFHDEPASPRAWLVARNGKLVSRAGKLGLFVLLALAGCSSAAPSWEPPEEGCGQLYECCSSLKLT